MATDKEIINLLKTGNFTIAYHDNGHAMLYQGRYKYKNLPEEPYHDFDYDQEGYISKEVELLTEALSGKTETI